jgi:hypothetical protein
VEAANSRITTIDRARIAVVTTDRLIETTERRMAGVRRARIAIVTANRLVDADARVAELVRACVSVVAIGIGQTPHARV